MPNHRAFLKWAGGKGRLMHEINQVLPTDKTCLIEPFVGAGSVFLNTNFEHYLLFDINPDLIDLFNLVKRDVETYIRYAKRYFEHPKSNSEAFYYHQRNKFNQSKHPFERAVLFLYLNRFGYNGLCRYNLRNEFNVPFGRFKSIYFPEKELRYFAKKAQKAEFRCADFTEAFQYADDDCVIYCDPPYAPLDQTTNFTGYAGNKFTLEHQETLAEISRTTAKQLDIPVIISNHDTPFTRKIYHDAYIKELRVQRFISQNAEQRLCVKELFAIF
ncbi:Dam family site-specific DNA-(adenine-N6)-methyltransferase [Actinobacillus delphinicola]|uniref:Site-specific DNA-methyltransferase (adenine-specific) n=1 Tax=Actinobacillus delphinicola TaxID=51161 RepID=A0A448TUM9_9PAST|nr:Dam family site-specific DNA-(adenine-N6)-methyltransferase [Actinobacillus delphinicola]VEJ09656.1 DNA adenine methylase [Actinobacillus delphinicola]